jgi:hypothetical protein
VLLVISFEQSPAVVIHSEYWWCCCAGDVVAYGDVSTLVTHRTPLRGPPIHAMTNTAATTRAMISQHISTPYIGIGMSLLFVLTSVPTDLGNLHNEVHSADIRCSPGGDDQQHRCNDFPPINMVPDVRIRWTDKNSQRRGGHHAFTVPGTGIALWWKRIDPGCQVLSMLLWRSCSAAVTRHRSQHLGIERARTMGQQG